MIYRAAFHSTRRLPAVCLIIMLLQLVAQSGTISAASAQASSSRDFSAQYTALTKKILLAGIELERFSLNFRMESAMQPKFRRYTYFLAQETGAATGLAFEVTGTKQFGEGRKRLLRVNLRAVSKSLRAAEVGSIIAASGSCLELSGNLIQAVKNRRHGYDHRSANEFVVSKLKEIDDLLAQRSALVAANLDHPAYERALAEGKVLSLVRDSFINEYRHFSVDTKRYMAYQNLFFLLNTSYNTVGAVAAGVANRGLTKPRLTGPANILFIVAGGLATASPILSQATGKFMGWQQRRSLDKQLGGRPSFDASALSAEIKHLEALEINAEGSLMPSLPASQRLAIYTESSGLFLKQLESETKTMRTLEQVAIQNSVLGPLIGGTLLTQGIVGTAGFYKYFPNRPKKIFTASFAGATVATVGTSMAVVGNAATLLAGLSNEHSLSKKKQLPSQLIKVRLAHLDDMEKTISAL